MNRRISIAFVLALAMVLAACGSDDDPAPAGATEQTQDEMSDDTMSDDTMSEDEMSDDAMTDEEMSDDAMTDEEMTDETMTDEEMTDEEMTDGHMPTTFTVTVATNADSALPTPLAPGVFLVHTSMDTLFVEGALDRSEGLEALAEDGDPSALVAALKTAETVATVEAFTNPDGGTEAGPALPGSSYSFSFEAVPGDYLTFATMFVQSNDWFFAPASSGINLFDEGAPLEGDITSLVGLWDAGTEVDETPGEGPNQAPRQAGPNTGDTEGAPIAAVAGYEDAITVTISLDR